MHRLLTVSIIALMCLVPSAQETSARQQILAASQAWWDAFLRADADRMATIETDDFFLLNNGVPTDKSRLAGIRSRGPIQRSQTLDVLKFEDFGTVATVSGYVNMTFTGSPPNRFPFSEVWVRQGTAWRIKSAHYARVMAVEPSSPATRFRPINEMDPELKKAMQARDAAIQARDAEAWGRLVTPDHLSITVNGSRETRATRMEALRGPMRGQFMQDQDPEFRSYGDRTVIYTYSGGSGANAQLVSEVWIKGDAGWQLAHRQATLK